MHTTRRLKFSGKASAVMLHRNYWKIINFLTPMLNLQAVMSTQTLLKCKAL